LSDPELFISYSREDRPRARLFAECLSEEGFTVWWDAALRSGETFDEVIERNLRAAKAVVVLWSPRSVVSRWVRAEATLADRRGCLAPVIIEPCDRPIIFELTHTTELSHWDGARDDPAWTQFVADLRRQVGGGEKPAAPAFPRLVASADEDDDDDDGACEQTQIYGYSTPASLEQHVLEVRAEGENVATYVIGSLGLRIGRNKPADIILADPSVSRTHCEEAMKEGNLVVSDLASTNGTFVDDERVNGSRALAVGSVLQVGNVRLVHEVRALARAG
jgi:hypothetical protein